MVRYIAGFSGSHGTGKTTVMDALYLKGHNVVAGSLSRQAQEILGWKDLSPAQESMDNMFQLQNLILDAMEERDQRIHRSQVYTVVDRTPADVWAYTKLWFEKNGAKKEYHEQMDQFRQRCLDISKLYAVNFFFPIRKEIAFVEQRNRASEDTREEHQAYVIEFMTNSYINLVRVVTRVSLQERLHEIETSLPPPTQKRE